MAKGESWALTDLARPGAVELRIGGEDGSEEIRLAVTDLSYTMSINSIPRAQCTVPEGEAVTAPQGPRSRTLSDLENEDLRAMRPARVVANIRGDRLIRVDLPWPEGEFTLFEGYFVGFAYQKARGKVSASMHLIHWLWDLAFSTTVTAALHPSSPVSLALPAAQTEDGTNKSNSTIAQLAQLGTLSDAVRNEGVWSAISELLSSLGGIGRWSSNFRSGSNAAGLGGDVPKNVRNDRAQRALNRIEAPEPLKLAVSNPEFSQGIAKDLELAPTENIAGYTFWDLIIQRYAAHYGLAILPGITKAWVVADVPAWSAPNPFDYWGVLRPSDYDSFNYRTRLSQPLRAVSVMAQGSAEYGLMRTQSGEDIRSFSVGGEFEAPEEFKEFAIGSIRILRPPAWAEGISAAAGSSSDSGGVNGNVRAVNGGIAPDDGGSDSDEDVEDLITTVNDTLDLYAQQKYIENALRGRTGKVHGRLRFDVGPGSHVWLQSEVGEFGGGIDELSGSLFAQVSGTSIHINAEQKTASTTFHLAYVRNEDENNNQLGGLSVHPLYGDKITPGVPLSSEIDIGR